MKKESNGKPNTARSNGSVKSETAKPSIKIKQPHKIVRPTSLHSKASLDSTPRDDISVASSHFDGVARTKFHTVRKPDDKG